MTKIRSRPIRRLKLSLFSCILLTLAGLAALYGWLGIAQVQQEALDISLMSSIQTGSSEDALAALRDGASVNARDAEKKPESFFDNLLRLLHLKPKRVEAGDTALIAALDYGEQDVVRELLARGADVKAKGTAARTALMPAAEKGYADIVRALLKLGVDPQAVDNDRTTTLMYALRGGNRETIQAILSRADNLSKQINTNNLIGDDLLMAAAQGGDTDSVRLLLDKGMNVNAVSGMTGMTPLHYAACAGKTETVKLLLDHGANVGARNRSGQTPLNLAAGEFPKIVALLLERGAKPDVMDGFGQTPLTEAIYHQKYSVEIARLLLEKGAKVDFRGSGGTRMMMRTGNTTALMMAVEIKRGDLVTFLLAHGADPNKKNADGETVFSIAKRVGAKDVLALLKAAGVKPSSQR